MKKCIVLLLALALCLCAAGCAKTMVAHTYEDLTIHLPEGFIELADVAQAQGLNFVFGQDPIAVNGLREEKATFAAYGLDLDAKSYGDFMIKANQVSAKMTQTDGIWNFHYDANGYTYVVTLHETETALWMVQAYCPTGDYNKVQKDMWEILSSVSV